MRPRILIISHNSFSNKRNNGKTLEALFYQFPVECLAQLFFHIGDTPDFSYCNRYFRITDIDVIRSCLRKKRIGTVLTADSYSEKRIGAGKKSSIQGMRRIKSKIGDWGRDFIWLLGKWKSPLLMQWIYEFNPDMVFYVGGKAGFSAKVAIDLSTSLKIPMVSYYTDDYLFSIDRNCIRGKLDYRRTSSIITKVINNSAASYVIGDYMAVEYSFFFKRPFKAIMNSVSIVPCLPYNNHKELTISYFGGLHLNRWKMIVRLAELLPTNVLLNVYTSVNSLDANISLSFKRVGVNYRGTVMGEELKRAMNESDLLLHVESDDVENRRFTRLAISTKIPEYLITGRPILGFGPSEVASMRLLSENDIGLVLSSDDEDKESQILINHYCSDYQLRRDVGLRGYYYATKHFDKEVISQSLIRDFTNIISQ